MARNRDFIIDNLFLEHPPKAKILENSTKSYPLKIAKKNPKKEIPGVANHVKNLTTPFAPDHNTPKEHTGGYGSFADKNRSKYIHQQEQLV